MLPISPAAVASVLSAGNFFVAQSFDLVFDENPAETISWEIYKGQLLPPKQTRQQRTFHAWNVYWVSGENQSAEPIVSIKWDDAERCFYVVRGILAHVWEAYESAANVIESRQTTAWVRELIGSIYADECVDDDALHMQLRSLLFCAVVGISRLPLTSVESPLPQFSLGAFGYFGTSHSNQSQLLRSAEDLMHALHADMTWLEKTKHFELLLRIASRDELPELSAGFAHQWAEHGHTASDFSRLLRTLINEVSLSPYTDFVEHLLATVQLLVDDSFLTVEDQIDFLSYILRQLSRHMTAYDLITFHHRGANYPDALLLDAVVKEMLALAETHPQQFSTKQDSSGGNQRKRIRRRALRQGWLLRTYYEGHLVPDAPTSPGENTRVLPAPHVRIPEEQILQSTQRKKKLYAGDSLIEQMAENAMRILGECMADLSDPREVRELGMAVFINRPFGIKKAVGEPDQTMLFSHEAFSRSIANQRLAFVAKHFSGTKDIAWDEIQSVLRDLSVAGLPAASYRNQQSGVVSLADAYRAAADFVFLCTTKSTVQRFFEQVKLDEIADQDTLGLLRKNEPLLIVPDTDNTEADLLRLIIYDKSMKKRLALTADLSHEYTRSGDFELPKGGFRVLE